MGGSLAMGRLQLPPTQCRIGHCLAGTPAPALGSKSCTLRNPANIQIFPNVYLDTVLRMEVEKLWRKKDGKLFLKSQL